MDLVRAMVSWVLALALVFMFVQSAAHPLPDPPAGQVKLFDLPGENIIFQTLAERSGYAIFEPGARVLTAYLELLAALLLLLPFSRRLGALLSVAILAGAIGLHLSPWLGREVPLSLQPNAPGDGGALFMLAVAMLAASVVVLFVHKRGRGR